MVEFTLFQTLLNEIGESNTNRRRGDSGRLMEGGRRVRLDQKEERKQGKD